MVPPVGLEPTHLAVPDFESGASTNSTTGAQGRKRVDKGFSLPVQDPNKPFLCRGLSQHIALVRR